MSLMKGECFDYRRIPGQNPLFLAFLYDFDRVADLYVPIHGGPDQLKERALRVRESPLLVPRSELVRLLEEFHRRNEASSESLENVRKLGSEKTVAVVTGQQAGLFAGPSYTIYKTATAVWLARYLESEGIPAVPVFWLASDDSDFQEIRGTTFADQNGISFRVSYPAPEDNTGRMVGTLGLERILEPLEQFASQGAQGEFGPEVVDFLKRTYTPSATFAQALTRWILALFGGEGLVVFDSVQPGYRSFLAPAFATAVERRVEVVEALNRRRELLRERGLPVQFQHDEKETLLFWLENGKRYKLEYADGRIRPKHRRSREFDTERLLQTIRDDPERFGFNVLLRPIVQDLIFPTAAYVGGPAEVAYFSQVNAISSFWGKDSAIFPRVGVTLVDRKAGRLLSRHEVRIGDVFNSGSFELFQRLLEKEEAGRLLERFGRVRARLEGDLESLERALERSEPPLADMMRLAARKMSYQLNKVQRRYVINQRGRNETLHRHVEYLHAHLFPEQKLQERVLNFNHFLAQEGFDLTRRLLQSIQPYCLWHQVLHL